MGIRLARVKKLLISTSILGKKLAASDNQFHDSLKEDSLTISQVGRNELWFHVVRYMVTRRINRASTIFTRNVWRYGDK